MNKRKMAWGKRRPRARVRRRINSQRKVYGDPAVVIFCVVAFLFGCYSYPCFILLFRLFIVTWPPGISLLLMITRVR